MSKLNIIVGLSLVALFCSSCGKDKLNSSSSSSSPVADSSSSSCKVASHSLQGCCSDHNGARNCLNGDYVFTSDGKLVCNDGSISPSCTN
jgi:hypothetical protein